MIKRMVADLHLPLEIIGIETVREHDGLALSSRNRFLAAEERDLALALHRTLRDAAERIATGDSVATVLADARAMLTAESFGVDYFALVDGPTLAPIDVASPTGRLVTAARMGTVRLLDNIAAPG